MYIFIYILGATFETTGMLGADGVHREPWGFRGISWPPTGCNGCRTPKRSEVQKGPQHSIITNVVVHIPNIAIV